MAVEANVFGVVGFQADQQALAVGAVEHCAHQLFGVSPALTGGAHRQIDDVQAVFVQLVGPAAVEVVSAAQEVEEGFQRRVVLNQKGVGLEGAVQLLGKVLEGVVRLGLIRDDDDAVQIFVDGVDLAVVQHLIQVAAEQLRQQLFPSVLVGDQLLIERVAHKALGQKRDQFGFILLCYPI